MEADMITISVCMIVKDEEKVLGRCLESLGELADEIIIVDTGSTDSTKQIAAKYTDKIYDFTWIHDFSAARNYSFSKATMDYIYVADADEVIDDENRQRFWLLKQNLLPEIEIVQMKYANQLSFNTTYNFDMEYRPKLYKRLRSFRWVEPVHENVILSPIIYDSDIVIRHMPLSNHAGRDFDTFQRVIKREGKLSPKLYEMYARELFIAGEKKDFVMAFPYFKEFSDQEEYSDRERKICECILVKCYRMDQDITGMMKYCLRNIADGKGSSEVCYELGEYFMENGDFREATIWYYNAAYETECELNIHYAGDYPLKRLAECYHLLGNQEQEEAFLKLYETWSIDNKG
jgi:glycosyltransferase involved in cell wall biosynthesis